ncbi:motility associated factor glycosyltransferase family protein [Saccharibacillus qingshengii]|uniref:motility associated factor glycosyltransferase family protein n=1 Tax=Saccharibacillus qingshengii TaxID=1763540 RepID=UPI001551EA64|nr:6-hydroxymethylpterin diphosphokinase MptE-like protein [Saccharibacillus qingshengii]
MDLMDRNVEILSANTDHWIGMPDENELAQVSFEVDRDGNEIFINGEQVFALKSEFDDSNQPNPLKRELIFILGISSVEEIKQVFARMGNESLLVIVEPNLSLFSYSLQTKDLSFLQRPGVVLFTDKVSQLSNFLDQYLLSNAIFYVKTIKFYFTHMYREQDLQSSLAVVKVIKESVNYKTMLYGNSVEDSLIGFRQHMTNLKHLTRSKDVSLLKNTMCNVPAVVVAAGPSLNKNINQLHALKENVIIIAVDTIAQRLCDEGIIPDFICSVERGIETYAYFYKDKSYPTESTLVGPLVLYPDIFEEYAGELVIPMRERVGEFIWLREVLELKNDTSISMGLSCAHVAFGVAEHLGASPIILLGQDLAYGNSAEDTHAGGTVYDDKNIMNSVPEEREGFETEGYYGGMVQTREIWNTFRTWFEMEISNKQLDVINATEGGAKIALTRQLTLAEVGQTYCTTKIASVYENLKNIPTYPLEQQRVKQVMKDQYKYFMEIKDQFEKQRKQVKRLKLSVHSSETELRKALRIIDYTENFFKLVLDNMLLRHCLQPAMINSVWNLYDIERVINFENVVQAQKINLGFLNIGVYALNEITATLQAAVKEL